MKREADREKDLAWVKMDQIKEIRDALRSRYDGGLTQQEMAKSTGVSRAYIAQLLSGARSVSGLTLDKFLKLFPKAVINLNGDTVSIHADENKGSVVGVNHGSVAASSADLATRILNAPDLTPEEKVKFLQFLSRP